VFSENIQNFHKRQSQKRKGEKGKASYFSAYPLIVGGGEKKRKKKNRPIRAERRIVFNL